MIEEPADFSAGFFIGLFKKVYLFMLDNGRVNFPRKNVLHNEL